MTILSTTLRLFAVITAFLLVVSVAPAAEPERVPDQFAVIQGVKLHYLDWGGPGPETLVLLADFGLYGGCARNFDGFAGHFTDRFRVVGLSRRGSITSDKAADGDYSTATRVEELRAFLDHLHVEKVTFLGQGSAGDEMTLFATRYPGRVNKLVYLEAYDDFGRFPDVWVTAPGQPPWIRKLLLDVLGAPEAAAMHPELKPAAEDYAVMLAMMKAAHEFHPDYAGVAAPALAIFGTPEKGNPRGGMSEHPWWKNNVLPRRRAAIEEFRTRMAHGKVVELDFASDDLAKWNWFDVVPQVRLFLLGEPLPRTAPPREGGWFGR